MSKTAARFTLAYIVHAARAAKVTEGRVILAAMAKYERMPK